MDREAWRAALHGVSKSWTRLSDWTILNWTECVTTCKLMDCSLPGSFVPGISRARTLEWVAISFSRGSSGPRDQTRVSCIVGGFLIMWATRVDRCFPKCSPNAAPMSDMTMPGWGRGCSTIRYIWDNVHLPLRNSQPPKSILKVLRNPALNEPVCNYVTQLLPNWFKHVSYFPLGHLYTSCRYQQCWGNNDPLCNVSVVVEILSSPHATANVRADVYL